MVGDVVLELKLVVAEVAKSVIILYIVLKVKGREFIEKLKVEERNQE